jgi:hypothetical protein
VQFSARGAFRGLILGSSAVLLAACGGGGGSGGDEGCLLGQCVDPVTLTVSADRVQLPLNMQMDGFTSFNDCFNTPNTAPRYLTTLYVQARTKSGQVLSGEDLFQFNILSGFESGSLYYLDGDPDHEVECTYIDGADEKTVDVPAAFRFGTLDAAANGATMHLLGTDKAGTVRVEFGVVEPVSNKLITRTIDVQVGGNPTGRPAVLHVDKINLSGALAPFLYPQGRNDPTMLRLQTKMSDEAGQPVTNPSTANLRACLIGPAGTTAYLQSGSATAPLDTRNTAGRCFTGVTTSSINGQAEFVVHSGNAVETLTIRLEADRADNNVLNGVTDPVYNIVTVPVVSIQPVPLAAPDSIDVGLYRGETVAITLPILGGVAPYTCELESGSLPAGFWLDSAQCVINGEATSAISGCVSPVIAVRDSALQNQRDWSVVNMCVYDPLVLTSAAALPNAEVGIAYSAFLTATGGAAPLTFSAQGLPPDLSIDPATGAITGTPGMDAAPACVSGDPTPKSTTHSLRLGVTDSNGREDFVTGTLTVTRQCN